MFSLTHILYSQKLGGELNLVVWWSTCTFAPIKLKSTNISYLIPYPTAKFKSSNIFAMVICGPTAKFNSCQYSGYMAYGAYSCTLYMYMYEFELVLMTLCINSLSPDNLLILLTLSFASLFHWRRYTMSG